MSHENTGHTTPDFQLPPDKQAAFETIVNEKYGGDLHAALRKAIDYFIAYETSRGMQGVSDKLKEIQAKLDRMRAASSEITNTLKSINHTNAQIQQNLKDQKPPKSDP